MGQREATCTGGDSTTGRWLRLRERGGMSGRGSEALSFRAAESGITTGGRRSFSTGVLSRLMVLPETGVLGTSRMRWAINPAAAVDSKPEASRSTRMSTDHAVPSDSQLQAPLSAPKLYARRVAADRAADFRWGSKTIGLVSPIPLWGRVHRGARKRADGSLGVDGRPQSASRFESQRLAADEPGLTSERAGAPDLPAKSDSHVYM